jgi:hypothetical protein
MKRPWWARPPRWASWQAGPLLALVALLAACGPGVGGSGTGEDQTALPPFGAANAALCGSELAPLLLCPSGASAPGAAGGTEPVAFSGRLGGQDVALQLQGNRAELRVGCTLLRFGGQWGQLAGQPERFYGYTDPDGQPAVATLEARLAGSEIELTLRDANGSVLFGPQRVARGAARTCG